MNGNNITLESDLACRDQYKVDGVLQMPPNVLHREDNVFFYLGHGSDICTDDGGLDIRKVPDNCMLITQTVCGLVNDIPPAIIRKFIDPANRDIWMNPIAHIEELKAFFGQFPNIHIHLPGCSYVNSSFSALSDFETEQSNNTLEEIYTHRVNVGLSGLLSLQGANTIPLDNEYIDNKRLVLNKYQGETYIPFATVQQFYPGSIFPPAIQKKEEGSFFPASHIQLNVDNDGDVKFEEFKEEIYRIANQFPISRLMELYPGIHYNFLCRVARNCEPERITLRRTLSATVQNTPLNSLYRIVRDTYRPNNDQAVAFARGIEQLLKSNPANVSSLAETTPITLPKTKNYFRTLQLEEYERRLQEARYYTFQIQLQLYMKDLFELMVVQQNYPAAAFYLQNLPEEHKAYLQTLFNPIATGGKRKKANTKHHQTRKRKTLRKRKA